MIRFLYFCFGLSVCISCNEPHNITFTEIDELYQKNAIIELNIPRAHGNSQASNSINNIVNTHVIEQLLFFEEKPSTYTLDAAIVSFDQEYKYFKDQFSESKIVWEASFSGEVTYQSAEVISIAITNYIDSGGAHGNSNVTFFNFDSHGNLLHFKDLFYDKEALIDIVKTHFYNETKNRNIEYFFNEDFDLPNNIGFNDEGIMFFYNVYDIASYADGITEFTVPYHTLEALLKTR
ncbi:DUF3298 domain-containing protein [Flavobacteriaceae bacterium]|nr:DUF3298 domain-containing protein [Flavobacteriaceae bacterium]